MKRFEGKTALVTGGRRGLGRAIVEKFLDDGASVVFIGSSKDAGEEAEKDLKDKGTVEYRYCDISDPGQVKELFSYVAKKYGHLDFLIDNASRVITDRKMFHEYDAGFVQKMVMTNVCGTYMCMKYGIEQMLKQENKGVIINISSASSEYCDPGLSVYAATKSAINTLTRNAAKEYGKYGIRINTVLPGGMMTEAMQEFKEQDPVSYEAATKIVPLNRWAAPSEVADAVAWLCSDEAAYITGAGLVIDGGNSL